MSVCLLHRPASSNVLFPACLFSRQKCIFIFQIDRMSAFFMGDFFVFLIFCAEPTRPARAGKCSLVPDRLVQPRKETPERLKRGGPYWLQKLRWMGTQRVQMKGVLPWLVCWACRAGTRDFVQSWLLQSAQYKIFLSSRTLFQIVCPLSISMCLWETLWNVLRESQYVPPPWRPNSWTWFPPCYS